MPSVGGTYYMGDVVLCDEVVKQQASQMGHSYEREFFVLLVHGLTHLLGFDHERSRSEAIKQMEYEATLLSLANVPPESGLVARVIDARKKPDVKRLIPHMATWDARVQSYRRDRTKAFRGRFIDVHIDTVVLPSRLKEDAHESRYEVVEHPGATAIAATTATGMFLLRQFRYAAGQYMWEIAAGTLEVGETIPACAKRELQEEMGLTAKRWSYLGPIFTVPGFCTEEIHLFEASDLSIGEVRRDDDEVIIDIQHFTWEELFEMVKEQQIVDAKTLAVITHLWARRQRV